MKPVTLTLLPSLRRNGIRIQVRHYRYVNRNGSEWVKPPVLNRWSRRAKTGTGFQAVSGHGGKTEVQLSFPDGTTATGTALCSTADRFDRREGIRIAVQRALRERKGAIHVAKALADGFFSF